MSATTTRFDVGGVLMPRPFKIRRLGHVAITVDDLDEAIDFYGRVLGFHITERMNLADYAHLAPLVAHIKDTRVVFATNNSDHHALVIVHRTMGGILGAEAANKEVNLSHLAWQVGSLAEVVAG